MSPNTAHPLVGSWRLRDWVAVDDGGAASLPMGPSPEGVGLLSRRPTGQVVGPEAFAAGWAHERDHRAVR